MTVLEKIYNFVKPKKNKVLVKSKLGLPSLRICSVVLVDACIAACPAQNTGFVKSPKPSSDSEESTQNSPETPSKDSKESKNLYLRASNQEVKNALLLDGVESIIFVVATTDAGKYQCIQIEYNKGIGAEQIIKHYQNTNESIKEVLYRDEDERNCYKNILQAISSDIALVRLKSFE